LRLVEERERIARDLHDVVVQRLFAIGLSLDSMSGGLPETASEQVRTATDELHHTIRDIRGAILTLHSDEPEQPLCDRLRIVVDRAELTLGFAPAVTLDPAIDAAPEEFHWHLLAMVREGLSNAARHSGATAVDVTVAVAGGELIAIVADNGCGLPDDRNESGLANLRRRAQIAGGSMTADPGPDGRGLVLTWRAPLPRR
jgi:signal transduction histidine kinase